jgi:hypothetical protein
MFSSLLRTLDLHHLTATEAVDAIEASLAFLTSSGARVQLLDADSPAFLAMARAGMHQATPQFQWFLLLLGSAAWCTPTMEDAYHSWFGLPRLLGGYTCDPLSVAHLHQPIIDMIRIGESLSHR